MQIGRISYLRRYNLGNFEHEELSIELIPNDQDTQSEKELFERCRMACYVGSKKAADNKRAELRAESSRSTHNNNANQHNNNANQK